ncbi:rhodanese-like domain-containing protein [Streptococcus sp. DD13]|uniref:rhodanese-like domain-containing protein n=1 Tax=Streptococcus sp. DD13 TaxID=1777881 RepID=UPI0007939125|nr:rhodanese-like domain-containing protein [Streptococcus sp. DD13]KXT78261.1 Rhodanese-like domain protein [Streptococcus sp. DD13]
MAFLQSLLLVILAFVLWFAYRYLRLRSAAKILSSEEFQAMMHGAQVIDIREADLFREKHILGARNIPYSQLKMSGKALRKDKPVLLYEGDVATRVTPAATYLKKQGYKDIYILNGGLARWTGKIKTK